MSRTATVERNTSETQISATVDLDGTGRSAIATGSGFLDHLLDSFARHSLIDVELRATGDLHIDPHHTAEDCGIVLGQAIDRALGDRAGIRRFGDVRVPMDEALAECAIDISGRYHARIRPRPVATDQDADPWPELVPHLIESLAREARLTVHLRVRGAQSVHHHCEALIKAFARALRAAIEPDPRVAGVPDTQGHARMIAVVDFGAGNTRSVMRGLQAVGAEARLATAPAELEGAERLVLPGVGAAPSAVDELHNRGLWDPVRDLAASGTPLLGICLGAQLMLDRSAEGPTDCLGLIAGDCRAFPGPGAGGPAMVPHIGWNAVELRGGESFDAYFVHSFWLDPADGSSVVGRTDLDGFEFPSLLRSGPWTATQFHPEKSGPAGRALLAAFARGLLDA